MFARYKYQVEADIAPFRGLLLGLFFVTVGFSIDVGLIAAHPLRIMSLVGALLALKTAVITLLGVVVGRLPTIEALRTGLCLAQGGEFAFVALGIAQKLGLVGGEVARLVLTVTALSMAATPFLAEGASMIGNALEARESVSTSKEKTDKELDAALEESTLSREVVVCGYGRVGRVVADLLNEKLIPWVAFDVDPKAALEARRAGKPVYYGDVSRPEMLEARESSVDSRRRAAPRPFPSSSFRSLFRVVVFFTPDKSAALAATARDIVDVRERRDARRRLMLLRPRLLFPSRSLQRIAGARLVVLAIEDKRATNKAIIGLRRAAAERKAADEAQRIEALEEQCAIPEAGVECPSPEDVATAVAAKAAAEAEAEAAKKIGGLFGENAGSTNFGPVILARAQDENHRKRLQNSLGVLAMVPKARARARGVWFRSGLFRFVLLRFVLFRFDACPVHGSTPTPTHAWRGQRRT